MMMLTYSTMVGVVLVDGPMEGMAEGKSERLDS